MAARNTWVPTGDLALLQLRLQAMPENPPELGVYSRLGWSHPGPAFWWIMWAGFTTLGATSGALLITMAALHAALLVLAWWLVRRCSSSAAVWVVAAGVAVLWARGSDVVLSPWNPYVGVTGVLALLGAGIAFGVARDGWGAFFLLPIASLLVQSHVGYTPLAVIVTAVAVVLALLGSSGRGPLPWFAFTCGSLVAVGMWLPPLFEQFNGDPGNLVAIITGVTGTATLSLTEAGRVVLAGFTTPPQWAPGPFGMLPSAGGAPWLLILPVVAAAVAAFRRDSTGLRLLGIVWAAQLAALVSAANLQPPAYEYLLPWLATASAALLGLSLWVLSRIFNSRAVATLVGFATVALAVAVGISWAQATPVLSERGQAARVLAEAVLDDAAGAPMTIQADPAGSTNQTDLDNAGGVATGMAVVTIDAGADVALDEQSSSFIDGVVPPAGPQRQVYYVRVVRANTRSFDEGTVAVYDPFTAAQWQQLAVLDEQLARPDLDPLTRYDLAQQRNAVTSGQVAYEVRRQPSVTR